MTLDKNVVIKALAGVLLFENPVLWEDNKPPTKEHYEAIKIVLENKDEFHQIVLNEVQLYPNTDHFFRNLIRLRLRQDKPLSSPLIQSLFPLGPIDLENRLQRIAHIPNIQKITKNAGPPESFEQGYETDELIKDMWAEFYVADLLVTTIKVDYIEKVMRVNSQTAVEFIVRKNNETWIVEVTRLRRRDFQGETMPWESKDCSNQENIDDIKRALKHKLFKKNNQIQKFVRAENCDFDKRIIAIKTSQEEYQDCSQIIAEVAKDLINENIYSEVTQILLIYDTSTYEFVTSGQVR